ncbi:hypothetical protein KBD45_02715 [Candidatus Dojkabacteria bacterium]|nr:hypothetical protein [Candidatus Dojkabacteria bacterium]
MALNLNPQIFSKLHDTPQKSALFIGLGTLILVLSLFVFAIVPATSSVIEQYEKNKRRQELVDEQETKIENINKLVTEEEKYIDEIGLLNENYPIFTDTEYIVRNIQDYMVSSSDIEIISIDIDEKYTKMPSFVTSSDNAKYDGFDIVGVPIDIVYYCSIEGSVKLLKFFENFPSILSVENLTYSYIIDDSTESTVSADTPYNCVVSLLYYTKTAKPVLTPVVVKQGASTENN